MVSWDMCEGNPGALQFMSDAYMNGDPFRAEKGFQRMDDNGIRGTELYMLWNDCCGRNTEKAVEIMCEKDISEIEKHINREAGRGIPFKNETGGQQC